MHGFVIISFYGYKSQVSMLLRKKREESHDIRSAIFGIKHISKFVQNKINDQDIIYLHKLTNDTADELLKK